MISYSTNEAFSIEEWRVPIKERSIYNSNTAAAAGRDASPRASPEQEETPEDVRLLRIRLKWPLFQQENDAEKRVFR